MIYSAYDYVVSATLGVHVDYNKSLGQQYEESQKLDQKMPEEHQLDSLIEKCSNAIKEIHRPIYKTNTAESATIVASVENQKRPVGKEFTRETYDYMSGGKEKGVGNVFHNLVSLSLWCRFYPNCRAIYCPQFLA